MQVKSIWQKGYLDAGIPTEDHYEVVTTTLDENTCEDGDIVVKVLCMSCDPYMRGRLKSNGRLPETGRQVVTGFVSGKVLASKSPNWKEGDLFGGHLPLSTAQVVKSNVAKSLWKLSDHISEGKISLGVGALGMPGSTAYGGLIDVLRPKEGEIIFVSAASGAVGSLVGQIAKHVFNCTTIGSCGGPAKVKLIQNEFGYDHAIDYKTIDTSVPDNGAGELKARLKEAAPDGIDMYFENVAGIHFDAAFASLRPHGRIAVCGGISGYNESKSPAVQVNIMDMIYSFQRIEGFVCTPWLNGEKGNFLQDMSKWIKEGKIKTIETFYDGVESWPTAFRSLFVDTHRNQGKVVIRCA